MNKAILRNSKIVIFGKKIISGNFFFQPARSETFFFSRCPKMEVLKQL